MTDTEIVPRNRDRELIGKRRRGHYRLVFAVHRCTVRDVGLFLENPWAVPRPVVQH